MVKVHVTEEQLEELKFLVNRRLGDLNMEVQKPSWFKKHNYHIEFKLLEAIRWEFKLLEAIGWELRQAGT